VATERFSCEESALALLGQIPSLPVAPRLYVADSKTRILVTEDLRGPSLADVTRGGDETVFAETLRVEARQLARIASYTLRPRARSRPQALRSQAVRLAGVITTEIGVDVPAESIARTISTIEDGPFRALQHGDVSPENFRPDRDSGRLVDFELADWDHPLMDLSSLIWSLSTPWIPIETPLTEELEAVYRNELTGGWPLARNDDLWSGELTAALTYRCLGAMKELAAHGLPRPWLARALRVLISRIRSRNGETDLVWLEPAVSKISSWNSAPE
jgi:hypothetical protein